MVDLVRVTPQWIAGAAGREIPFPVVAYVAVDEGEVVAAFGLAWHHERCWLWFGDAPVARRYAIYVIRWGQRMIRLAGQMGETEVYSMRVEGPKSKRLHERLGFQLVGSEPIAFDDGRETTEEIWRHGLARDDS
jgi:hypothetical protein